MVVLHKSQELFIIIYHLYQILYQTIRLKYCINTVCRKVSKKFHMLGYGALRNFTGFILWDNDCLFSSIQQLLRYSFQSSV